MTTFIDMIRIHTTALVDDEDGLTTTELAILIAALVVIAAAAALVFYSRAIGFAEAIPDNVPPPGP